MRVPSVVVTSILFLATTAGAQTPAKPAAKAPVGAPDKRIVGTLAQVMRGVYFPNANLLFDVQAVDPAAPPKNRNEASGGASATFANIYAGWQVVENAAIVLAESSDLLNYPGRKCQNGKPVPVGAADWASYVKKMRDAGTETLRVARTKNQAAMIEATNVVADACSACHESYRDRGEADSPERCPPPTQEQQKRIDAGAP